MTERTVAPQAPDYLIPTTALVNTKLQNVRLALSYGAESRRGLTDWQRGLQVALTTLTYDGVQITACDVQQTLKPFTQEHSSTDIKALFENLVTDLEYVDLLEKGGIDGVNQRISDLFQTLQSDISTDEKEQITGKLNHVLGRAIYIFPHLVNSVEVKLKPGTEEKTEEFEKKYGSRDYYRSGYNMLRDTYQEETGQPFPEVLVIPLPNDSISGVMRLRAVSQEDVSFGSINPIGRRDDDIPALALKMLAPLVTSPETYFTLDEVEEVKFSQNANFTPYVNGGRREHTLIGKGNPITHYLRFRDFEKYVNKNRERENLPGLTDEEWENLQKYLMEPGFFSRLWIENYRARTLDGFIGVWSDDPQEVTLYELHGVKLPKGKKLGDKQREANAILFTQLSRGDKKVTAHSKEYKGREVIERLAEIPVQERYF